MNGILPDASPEQKTAICAESDQIPNSYVQSCHECCYMYGPDGKSPNILGQLQQKMMTKTVDNIHGHFEWLDCAHCPVTIASCTRPAKTGDGKYIYWKDTDTRLTEDDLLKLEEDGNDVSRYCEFRET